MCSDSPFEPRIKRVAQGHRVLWSRSPGLAVQCCPLVAVATPARSLPPCLSLSHKCLLFQGPCSLEVAESTSRTSPEAATFSTTPIQPCPRSPRVGAQAWGSSDTKRPSCEKKGLWTHTSVCLFVRSFIPCLFLFVLFLRQARLELTG